MTRLDLKFFCDLSRRLARKYNLYGVYRPVARGGGWPRLGRGARAPTRDYDYDFAGTLLFIQLKPQQRRPSEASKYTKSLGRRGAAWGLTMPPHTP